MVNETSWEQNKSSIFEDIGIASEKIKYMHSGPIIVGPEMARHLIESGLIKKSDITVIEGQD